MPQNFMKTCASFASHKEREVIALWGRGTYDLFYAYLTHRRLAFGTLDVRSIGRNLLDSSRLCPDASARMARFGAPQACGREPHHSTAAEIARDSRHFLRLEETKSALIASYGEENCKDFYKTLIV